MSHKILVVGDPHVTVEELDDCQALMNLVMETVNTHKPERVVILGDLHHNHAVVRVEVMDFWRKNLQKLSTVAQVYCLVGNHDRSHDGSLPAHALQAYSDLVTVVDEPTTVAPGILAIPYYHREEDFIEAVNGRSSEVLFCHQSFNGARFDNGFYDPQGFDPELVPQKGVIAGHIHTPQSVGDKIWYVGAPRWRTASDANVTRSIWVLEFEGSEMVSRTPIHTDTHCRKLIDLTFREGLEMTVPDILGPCQVSISLHGSQEWVDSLRDTWTRSGALVRTFPTRKATVRIRESEGIAVALEKHIKDYKPRFGTPTETLKDLVAKRVSL